MSRRFKRIVPLFELLVGVVGVVICAAAIIVVWNIGWRLTAANEKVFDRVEASLATVGERILRAQQRVQESKITTEDVGKNVRSWAKEKTSERLASRPEVEKKVGQLATGLRQANVWLETSEASLLGVQEVFEMAASLGASIDDSVADPLLEKLGVLRDRLQQSTDRADAIRENMAKAGEGEPRDEQIAQLVMGVVATLSEIDSRMGNLAERVADTKTKGQQIKSKTRFYIVTAQIFAVLLVAWMAAGQVCICRYGWRTRLLHRCVQ